MSRTIFSLLLILFANSCSIKRMAIGQLGPAISDASPRLQHERNWEFFKSATPGSLQLSEILLEADPGNASLQALLTKGFGAYGYIVNDTEYLADRLQDLNKTSAHQQGVYNLSKALEYGFAYLEDKNVDYQGIVASGRNNKAFSYLDSRLDGDKTSDLETAFFTGTSWLLLANMNKDNLELVGQISTAFELIDWVCKKKPEFQDGLCITMQAVFYLARPKTLGGKPELALKLLNEAMKKYPENLLIPVVYLEWYIVPFMKESEFKSLKPVLTKSFTRFREEFYIPGRPVKKGGELLRLFNAMAEKRFNIIVKLEQELF